MFMTIPCGTFFFKKRFHSTGLNFYENIKMFSLLYCGWNGIGYMKYENEKV